MGTGLLLGTEGGGCSGSLTGNQVLLSYHTFPSTTIAVMIGVCELFRYVQSNRDEIGLI